MSAAAVDLDVWPDVVEPGTAPDPEEVARARILSCIRTGDWLDAQTFPPLQWAVPGVVPEGFGLIVGPPKLGKSWLVLGIALAVAAGGRAFGRVDVGPSRPTLYMALEDGDRRLQDRCRKLLVGERIPHRFHYATTLPEGGSVLETMDAWLTQHEGHSPLVVLDTLGKVMPPAMAGESAYARDYRIGSWLKRISDAHPGCTLLVVHHTRKAEGSDWMDSTSGTQGLNGSADFTIALARSRNETAAVLKVTGRDVREAEYAMDATEGSWVLAGTSLADASRAAQEVKATANLGDRSAEIVAFVGKHPEGVSASDVGTALDLKDARRYLSRLVDSGRLERAGRGTYTSVPSVPSVPFEWDNPPDGTHGTEVSHSRDTPSPANGTHGTDGTPLCDICGGDLSFALSATGYTAHPSCG